VIIGSIGNWSTEAFTPQAPRLNCALAFGEEGWIVTQSAVTEAADGKAWIERKSCIGSGPRLILLAE
jgi:hypothetical protein